MKKLWLYVPLAIFCLLLGFAAYQMSQPKDEFVRSTMIDKRLPQFTLPAALPGGEGVSAADFADGQPRLLNFWASWCLPCIAEAPQLEALKEEGASIVGIAIRDQPEDVARFLEEHGNPYTAIASDDISAVQLALGSSGLPETFVIDGDGVVRYQHIGDIRAEHVPVLLAELRKAE